MSDSDPAVDVKALALRPCPFCTERNVAMEQFGRVYYARCDTVVCQALGPEGSTPEEAASKWNQRKA